MCQKGLSFRRHPPQEDDAMSQTQTLTPSVLVPARVYIPPRHVDIEELCGRVRERVRAAVRKSRLTAVHFQDALDYPGTGLEDEIRAAIVRYSKKVFGIA